MVTAAAATTLEKQRLTSEEETMAAADGKSSLSGVVAVQPKPKKGLVSSAVDFLERVIVYLMHDSSKPLHYLVGNFAPVRDETPPSVALPVRGSLPDCLNGEFVRVGPNPKFPPVAGYHWFDGDGMIHGLRIKDGKATYVSRYVKTSRLKQEEYFGGAKFMKIGDIKGLFGLFMVQMQLLRAKLKVLDVSYGTGTGNTALIYHRGQVLALSEADKPYVIKVLEDGDLQTLGMVDYDKRLAHSFTAHPKVDPFTDEMFTFGYSQTTPYVTYRVITKDGVMLNPVPITIPEPIMIPSSRVSLIRPLLSHSPMAEVMDAPADTLDRPERQPSPADGSPLPPPPPPPRRRERDSRERRDDYYDSTHRSPPPPPPPPLASRDRDYRRRSSLSPPPYRDRRHSPPRRSPPPGGFKRSRRDDGGYERRRGSPRYGYDYGGYDRGGRGGYDERSHGRYVTRPSDWPDSGRGGFNVSQPQREGLMTYKQFIQELEDDILPAEAERRYEEYRMEYISTQKRAYFETHKDEEWLKDKYHPTNLVAVIERRNEHARAAAKEILLDLQSGTLDLGPGLTGSMPNKSGNASDPNSEDEADVSGKRRRHGRGPAKENDISTAPKAHAVSFEPRRIQVDIVQAQALVRKVDIEKGIEDNILSSTDRDKLEGENSHGGSMGPIIIIRGLTTVKGLEGAELLDTLITYLWRVHGIDYYGMSETNEGKGLRHIRADLKTFDGSNAQGSGADWEKKLDSFWKERLMGRDPLEIMTAKEKIDAAAVEALDPYVRKIRDEKYGWKYGCGAKGCTKLFHAAEFVHKHLRLKHTDLVMDLTSKVREDLYFQNYMNDPKAPGGTPIMQQLALKDKVPRRRSVLDGRLRDERGGGRDQGKVDRPDDERFDRSENSPSRDGSGGDDHMHDAYGGQGLHGASPFSSDIPLPPPVLMPVPGAGPLGPFVPAPPEVAMRMMREQGGASSLEANGGPRGRKGRSGPLMGPPGPILGIPPAFRHDPRRMRSYQDLDAPEDEVTVMDYRSL